MKGYVGLEFSRRQTLYLELIYIVATGRDMRSDENHHDKDDRGLHGRQSLYLESLGERRSKGDREIGGKPK